MTYGCCLVVVVMMLLVIVFWEGNKDIEQEQKCENICLNESRLFHEVQYGDFPVCICGGELVSYSMKEIGK